MKDQNDDHLPPSPPVASASEKPAQSTGAPASAAAYVRSAAGWADRVLFAAVGLLAGFAAAYVYLDKVPGPGSADPHAGVGAATMGEPPAAAPNPAPADPNAKQRTAELEQALAASEGKYTELVQIGNRAYDLNLHGIAVKAYEKALAIRGDDPNVLTDVGVSQRSLGNSEKALRYFESALKSAPDHWQALFNVVIVEGFDRGDLPTARKRLDELKKLRATHPEMPPLDKLEEELGRVTTKK